MRIHNDYPLLFLKYFYELKLQMSTKDEEPTAMKIYNKLWAKNDSVRRGQKLL